MSELAWIFPGQGAQFIGMGKMLADAFPAAKAVFETVNDALDQDLSGLMWHGDAQELTRTVNTQPALLACAVAAMTALDQAFNIPVTKAKFAAGHSLGEYSALTIAGAISLSDAARLLRIRGEAMQSAVPAGQGGMAALLGAEKQNAETLIAEAQGAGIIAIANDNAKGQIVLSGDIAAIDVAIAEAKRFGIKKAMKLNVSAPFHCPLMRPAAEKMQQALSQTPFSKPKIPVISNISVKPHSDPDIIKSELVAQVTGQVRWRETMHFMAANGITRTAEMGCGKVLSVMNRRTVPDIDGVVLDSPEGLESFAKSV